MKIIKKILLIIIFIIFVFVGYFTYQGYLMYTEAILKTPIEERIAQIKEDKNYTKIEELPDTYKNAVIAVEDHSF